MPSTAKQIAEAVKTELNAATFSQAFTADRVFLPLMDLKDLDGLQVKVAGQSIDGVNLDRNGSIRETHVIDVAVQKRLAGLPEDSANNAEPDGLLNLVEEIADHFRSEQALPGFTDAKYVGHTVNPLYAPDHLKEMKVFTSVISFSFSIFRA